MITNKISLLFILLITSTFAQQKITVEAIYKGQFRPNSMDELQAMPRSNQYTVLNLDEGSRNLKIESFDFATMKKVNTLIDTKSQPSLYEGIDSYSFSNDEKMILIANNRNKVYRYSFKANYFLYNVETKELTKVLEQVQEPTFSPDGKMIAYVKDNNIYYYNIASKTNVQITTDGKKNHIINGITDWVYEEEFAVVKVFDWSEDSQKLAYIRFDESQVPEFSMSVFGKNLYPKIETFKYPKAGEKNSEVSLHLYNFKLNDTKKIDLSQYKDFYIPRIEWTKDANILSAKIINRHQNNLYLLFIDGTTGETKVILNEIEKTYIDFIDKDNLTFLKNNSFIWTSEKDGFNHIYHYDHTGKLINKVTKGNWEVTEYYGFDEKTQNIFYQSTENGSINRDVFRINISGKDKVRLSTNLGTNTATFSPNFRFYINTFSSASEPYRYTLNESKKGNLVQIIENNDALVSKLEAYNLPQKEFFILKTEKGNELNAWIMKPKDFDSTKKYSLFMSQYSGPGSQEVKNEWGSYDDYWFAMLAQKGYVIACVDGRGTGFKGADFKKVTYKQLGKYELEDQIDAAKVLGNYSYIDKSRIGIWGWSFGGFMSSNCILKGNDIFKMAIAVAPVTNWRFYDSIYTERYMQTPQENSSGYDENSPINFAEKLKGKYLLIHGSGDDNVHVQNTMQMMESLIQKNKQFDSQIYPDKNHGIYGGQTRIQLFSKMTTFIENNL